MFHALEYGPMHAYATPNAVRERVMRLQGKPHTTEIIDAARAALVVIDMQNHFVAPGFPGEAPVARDIVPNINRVAAAMRAAGGKVIWIQTTATGATERWPTHHRHKLSPASAARRLESLAQEGEGFKLYPQLEALPVDLRVTKIKYSAMIPGSSNLGEVLAQHGLDTLLIAGTKTNACCESTARDASMLNHRVTMLSDCNAAWNDEEHAGALNNFLLFFGDVLTADEALARLAPAAAQKSA